MQEIIKHKIESYIIPIAIISVMGMMLFQVNDPFYLKTILLLLAAFVVKPFGTYRWTMIDWAVLAIWGYDIISCFISINMFPSISYLPSSTNSFLIYHLVRYSFTLANYRSLQKGFLGLCCIAVVLSCFTFFFFYKNAHSAGFADLYPVRFLYKPLGYDTNSWNTILLGLLGVVVCQSKSKVVNVLTWTIVTLLLLSFSRSIYITLVVFTLLLLGNMLKAHEKSVHIRCLLALAFSLLFVVGFFYKEAKGTASLHATISQQRSSQSRVNATTAAFQTYKEHPILGVGNGNYTLAIDKRLNQDTNVPFTPFAPNWLVKLLVERGIIGILLFLVLVGGIVFFLFARQNKQYKKFIGFVLIAILLKEMSQCTLFDNSTSLALFYILLAMYIPEGKAKLHKKNNGIRLILPIACCCIIMCFVYAKVIMPFYEKSTAQLINQGINSMHSYNKKKDAAQWKNAERCLLLAKELQPQDVQIDLMLFDLYSAKGMHRKARSYIRELVEAYPNNALFQYKYFAYLCKQGCRSEAFSHLEAALRIYPKLITLEEVEKMRNKYHHFFSSKKLVKDAPIMNEQDYACLGVLAFYLHDYKTAKKYCSRISLSMPNLFMPWLVLCHVYQQEHNIVAAEKCKRKFLYLSYGVIDQRLLQDESRLAIPLCQERFLYNGYKEKYQLWYGQICPSL